MANVLQLDCTNAFPHVSYLFGTAITGSDVWVTVDCSFDATLMSLFATEAPGQSIVSNADQFGNSIDVSQQQPSTIQLIAQVLGTNVGTGFTVTDSTWYTLEVHLIWDATLMTPSFIADVFINGTQIYAGNVGGFDGAILSLNSINLQAQFGMTGGFTYFDNFKVGTTRGASDILSDDFESGTLALWNNGTAGATIVSDPFAGGGGGSTGTRWEIDHLDNTFAVLQTVYPENLHFVLNVGELGPHTIDYELSLSAKAKDGSAAISHDFIGPYRTGWRLRYGTKVIAQGLHSQVNGVAGEDYMKIAGVSYLGYLQRRQLPFDPTRAWILAGNYKFGPTSPPRGISYQTPSRDVALIAKDIIDHITAQTYSLPLDTSLLVAIGTTIPYRIDLGDTSTGYDMWNSLSQEYPGFDFEVTYDLKCKIYKPFKFGDPANVAISKTDPGIVWVFDTSTPGVELEFTNTGPAETHILGLGSGLTSRLGVALGETLNESTFWRLDNSIDFGDILNRTRLANRTQQQFSLDLQPVHEISVTIDVGQVEATLPSGTTFWDIFEAGVAIWITWDLLFHQIDSAQRIVSLDCTVDTEGNAIVKPQLNQIYDTLGHNPGSEEA